MRSPYLIPPPTSVAIDLCLSQGAGAAPSVARRQVWIRCLRCSKGLGDVDHLPLKAAEVVLGKVGGSHALIREGSVEELLLANWVALRLVEDSSRDITIGEDGYVTSPPRPIPRSPARHWGWASVGSLRTLARR